jgi:predicted outer membrane repeat protein
MGCSFVRNTARYGGAVYIESNLKATIDSSEFINNTARKVNSSSSMARGGSGGAVWVRTE